MTGTPQRTALYRIYTAADLLLYIGISKDFGRRWSQHAWKQPWWNEHRRMTVYWYDSRREAEDAEETAIGAEVPKYNIVHAARNRETLTASELLALPVAMDLPTAAQALGIGRSKAFGLARRGEFPCAVYRLGRFYRVRKADLVTSLSLAIDGSPLLSSAVPETGAA